MVANRLMEGRSSFAGTSPRSATGVALPCVASDHAASATKMNAGSHVPYPPRFCSRFPMRRPTTFMPTASQSPARDSAPMNTLSSPKRTKRGPPAYAAIAAVATSSEGK